LPQRVEGEVAGAKAGRAFGIVNQSGHELGLAVAGFGHVGKDLGHAGRPVIDELMGDKTLVFFLGGNQGGDAGAGGRGAGQGADLADEVWRDGEAGVTICIVS
jgi:hypothetical protein